MSSKLIDPTFLFRFEVAIQQTECKWTNRGLKLPTECRLPSFGGLDDRPVFADVRMGWCSEGLGIHVTVNGKGQLPWCRGKAAIFNAFAGIDLGFARARLIGIRDVTGFSRLDPPPAGIQRNRWQYCVAR